MRRVSTYDGLGRLARVEENSVHTCYEYDVLGNLTKVRQGATVSGSACTGGQARTFVYDALSRLTSAANPESGTVSYTYDGAGNVLTERDGRGGVATHAYDVLNRITETVYSGGGTGFDATPDVTYVYDAGATTNCKNKGRLTSVSTSVSTTSYGCYDAFGQVKASTQTTSGDAARAFAYAYNADGTLKTQTYPSGLVVAYEYDAAGRPKKVGKTTVGETDYAEGIVEEINGKEIDRGIEYAAHGGVKTLRLGNGLYESRGYNARLQPTAIRLGTEAGGSQKLSLAFAYGTMANNGNVLSQTIALLEGSAVTQRYRYDGANRLGLAAEGGTAPTGDACPTDAVWCRDYSYDAYGNRAVTGTRGHTPAATPTATSAYSATTNRITAGSYDGAGNLLSLAGVGALSYDAENRLTAYDNNIISLEERAAYAYDGLGQRVKRTTTIRGASETTVYVYDAMGRLAAEYSSVAPVAGTGGTFYRTEDHLGSTRAVTKQDQTVAECRDFFPFGERIGSGLNGRSADCYGGTGDALAQQFTGKERDKESSLDYFGARYYSARLGRFVSPDAPFADQFALAPQSWSLYGYVRNNPLRFLDPTGYRCVKTDDGSVGDDGEGEMCQAVVKDGPHIVKIKANDAPTTPTAQERLLEQFWQRSQPDRPLRSEATQVLGDVSQQTSWLNLVCPGTAGVFGVWTGKIRGGLQLGGGGVVTEKDGDIAGTVVGSVPVAGGAATVNPTATVNTGSFDSAFEVAVPVLFPIGSSGFTAGPLVSKTPGGIGFGFAIGYGNFSVGLYAQQSVIQRGIFGRCPEQ